MKQEKQARKDISSRINDGHYLELMDRLHCQMSNMEDHLLDHPASMKHKDVRKLVIKAIVDLVKAYQLLGGYGDKRIKKRKTK